MSLTRSISLDFCAQGQVAQANALEQARAARIRAHEQRKQQELQRRFQAEMIARQNGMEQELKDLQGAIRYLHAQVNQTQADATEAAGMLRAGR